MKIENLTNDEAVEVQELLKDLASHNPRLAWSLYPMKKDNSPPHFHPSDMDAKLFFGPDWRHENVPKPSPDPEISQLREELMMLRQKIELIFGGHVLLNGRWVKL